MTTTSESNASENTSATAREVTARMASVLRLPEERITGEAALKDLVAESFLLVELAIELQEELDVRFSQEDLKEVVTVSDLVALIERRRQG